MEAAWQRGPGQAPGPRPATGKPRMAEVILGRATTLSWAVGNRSLCKRFLKAIIKTRGNVTMALATTVHWDASKLRSCPQLGCPEPTGHWVEPRGPQSRWQGLSFSLFLLEHVSKLPPWGSPAPPIPRALKPLRAPAGRAGQRLQVGGSQGRHAGMWGLAHIRTRQMVLCPGT